MGTHARILSERHFTSRVRASTKGPYTKGVSSQRYLGIARLRKRDNVGVMGAMQFALEYHVGPQLCSKPRSIR